ncbi:MAG: hypothetical protein Q8P13_04850 [bacterium]|nr:hypothetical protein [bacterium]
MTDDEILKLRKEYKLHEVVEDRLVKLFKELSPTNYTLKEGIGLTSGRTDTSHYIGGGKIIHVEVIASANMVAKDLLNLHQSVADGKVVVLMDEEIDPTVTKEYFSDHATDRFPRLSISEVLDEDKKEAVLVKLADIVQEIDKTTVKFKNESQKKFDQFLKDLNRQGELITYDFGFFPRKNLGVFQKLSDAEKLYHELDPLGFSAAAGLHRGYGLSWEFGNDGKFLRLGYSDKDNNLIPFVSVGDYGEVIHTSSYHKEGFTEIHKPTLLSLLNPVVEFYKELVKKKGYKGMVDVIAHFSGFEGLKWVTTNDPAALIIRGKAFYSDEITCPVFSITAEDLQKPEKVQSLIGEMLLVLERNSNKIPWSR